MSMIGSIYVEVRGDTTKFQADMTRLRSEATKGGTEVSNALNNAILPGKASKAITALNTELLQLSRSAKVPQANIKATTAELTRSMAEVAKKVGLTTKEFSALNEKMVRNQAMQTAESSMRKIAYTAGLSKNEIKALGLQMGLTGQQASQMSDKLDRSKSGLAQFGSSVMSAKANIIGLSLAVAGVVYSVKSMTEAIWDAGQRTLVAENAYKAITGSVEAADKQFAFLSKTATELGLNFYTLREGYKNFLAAAQSSKLPMVDVQRVFKSVSNAGAVLGLSNEKMGLTFLALEQMLSKGKVSMEEIRRQMGDNLPGAFQIGAKAMGMTVEAFDKAVSAGKVYSDVFLPRFARALEDTFQGTIAESVKAVNLLSQEWETFKLAMSEGDFMHSVAEAMGNITEILKDPDTKLALEGWARVLGDTMVLASKVAAAVGKDFSRKQTLSDAARFKQMGLYEGEYTIAPEELQSIVAHYREVERLAISAQEKIAANAEETSRRAALSDEERAASAGKASRRMVLSEEEIQAAIEVTVAKQKKLQDGRRDKNLLDPTNMGGEIKLLREMWDLTVGMDIVNASAEGIAARQAQLDEMRAAEEAYRQAELAEVKAYEEKMYKVHEKSDAEQLALKRANLLKLRNYSKARRESIVAAEQEIADLVAKIAAPGIKLDEERAKATAKISDEYKKLTMSTRDYGKLKVVEWFKAEAKAAGGVSEELQKLYDLKLKLIDKAADEKLFKDALAKASKDLDDFFRETATEALKAQKKTAEEYAKAQEKYAKEVSDAHADMSDTIQGYTADIIADWDNAGDILVNIAKRTAAEMAAAFLTQQFIMPVVQTIGGSMGMMWNNVPVSAMGSQDGVTGQSGMGFPPVGAMQWAGSNIPGMGALGSAMAWQLPGSGVSVATPYAAQYLGMSNSVTMGGTSLGSALGYGAWGSLGYQYLGGALGLPQGKYSGIGAGVGSAVGGTYGGAAMAGMGFKAGSWAGPIGMAVGAILGGIAGSLFGKNNKEPKVRVLSGQWGEGHGQPGELNSDFGYRTWIQDVEGSGNRSEIGNAMMLVFDAQFQAIEDATSWGLKEALAGTSFFMSTAKFKDYDNDLEKAFTAMSDDVFRQINQSLVSAMGLSSVGLDTSFFEGLRADGETLLQTFARFATIVESIDDFSGRMDQQVADGKTAEQAFGNLVVIAETLQAVTSVTDAIGTSSGINNVRNMIQAQADYMKALKDAVATQDELAQVQVGISQQIGASISGLTADSLQSVLASGGDITGVLQATVKNTAAQTIAGLASESIMAEYGNSLNQLIGDAFKNINAEDLQTSDLIDALNSIINDFDWDSMDAEVSAAADAINDFIAEIEQASKSVDELKNTYLDYLQEEIDIRQTAFDNAKNVLEGYIAGEERLIDARRQAAKSIDDFINGLMGSPQAPVQSLEFFEKRYAQLLSDAQTAGPDDIGNAVSALTSFTSQYLDFAGAYGGQNYNTLFNSVVSDLESVGADQLDQADVQTRELRDIKDLIGDTDGKLFDLNEAVQSFVDAKIGLDESAWMVQELNSLASIDSNLLLLYDAQRAYYGKVDTSKEPPTPTPEMDYVQYLYSTIGRSGFGSDMGQIDPGGYQYWSKASKTMSPEELSKAFYNAVDEYAAQNPDYPRTPTPETDYVQYLYSTVGRSGFGSDMNQIDPEGYQYWIEASKTLSPKELSKAFYNAVHEYIAQNPDDPYTQFVSPYMGYADGGIISGPTSGYQLPGATFHGTEAIVPLKNGSIPVDIRSGNQDIRVVVKIGNRELKDITTEIIRTDPEAQGQIRRVANG